MSPTRIPLARFLVAAAALASVGAGPVLAGHPPHHERQHGWGDPGDDASLHEKLRYRLELTEDQLAQMRGFHEARQPALAALHERMAAARLALFDAIHAETIDAAAIKESSAAVGALDTEFSLLRAEMYQEMRSILTEEQRAEASEMLDEMRAYREDHPGGVLPRRHGPRPDGPAR